VQLASILPNSPAEKAGLKVGDIVLAVDDHDVSDLSLWQVATMIKGQSGSKVKLTIVRGDSLQNIEVTRDKITADSVTMEQQGDILLVRLSRFDENSDQEFQDQLKKFDLGSVKGMILDLRGNPGGYFDSAVTLADEFLSDGLIVQERSKDKQVKEFRAKAGQQLENMPVAVLINHGSASASEILAGAIQGNKRGKLIGEPSYGKGSMQEVETLSDGSLLKLTVAEWLTPDGTNLRLQGLQPDFVVELAAEGEDSQLAKAQEILHN
jgi:carboxyl-terminal processing protease